MNSNELDHIEQQPSVVRSTRIKENVSIIWADTNMGPAMNAVEVAADHGIDVTHIKDSGLNACYRVEV